MWAVKAYGMPAPKRIQGPAQLIGFPRQSMEWGDPSAMPQMYCCNRYWLRPGSWNSYSCEIGYCSSDVLGLWLFHNMNPIVGFIELSRHHPAPQPDYLPPCPSSHSYPIQCIIILQSTYWTSLRRIHSDFIWPHLALHKLSHGLVMNFIKKSKKSKKSHGLVRQSSSCISVKQATRLVKQPD